MNSLRRMWLILRPTGWLFLGNFLLWGLFHVAPLGLIVLSRAIFDNLSGEAVAGFNPWTLLVFVLLLGVGRMGIFQLAIYAWATLFVTVQARLHRNLLDWLMTAPGTRFLPGSSGEAVSRFRDDVQEIEDYVETMVDFAGDLLFVVGGVLIMARIDLPLTLVVLAPLLLILLIVDRTTGRLREYRRQRRIETSRVTSYLGEIFGAARAIVVAGAEPPILGRLERLNEGRRAAALRDTLLTQLLRAAIRNVVNLSIGLVLLLAADAMRAGTFTVGDFALFVTFLPRATDNVAWLGQVVAQHKRIAVAFNRLDGLLVDAPESWIGDPAPLSLQGPLPTLPAVLQAADPPLERLELSDIGYAFADERRALDGVDLEIRRGELVVVTGAIGAGKSTLLRLLLGLLPLQTGQILWNGAPVTDPTVHFVPPRSAYIPQLPRLVSESVRDNILMGWPGDEEALAHAVHLAVLGPDIAALPAGLESRIGARGTKLSGGQIQRTAAARAFVRRPDLLVVDDLSSALDVETERLLWKRLLGDDRPTCLVVSHRRPLLEAADQVVLLEEGRVVDRGPLPRLLQRTPAMRALLDHAPTP